MGDLPFIVAGDSADAWAHPQTFRLDLCVSTPPEGGDQGQDWGLPAYHWDELQKVEFAWIRRRAARARALFSSYRVDHVLAGLLPDLRALQRRERGLLAGARAGATGAGGDHPAGDAQHRRGHREDLGSVPPFLRPSLQPLGVPGYKVLRWEKDRDRFADPAGWPQLSVATNATHDTETTADWCDALSGAERAAVAQVPGLQPLEGRQQFDDTVRDSLLRVLYAAPSKLVVIPFQDAFGQRERINVPGTVARRTGPTGCRCRSRPSPPMAPATTACLPWPRPPIAGLKRRRGWHHPGEAGRYRPVARP
jgi:4-alpha-glucanotransferase